MQVSLVAARSIAEPSGLSRYERHLLTALRSLHEPDLDVRVQFPRRIAGASLVRRIAGLDAQRFFETYPLGRLRDAADLVHLTRQTFATLLSRPSPQPVVVTVHDIFPFLHRADPDLRTYAHRPHEWFDALAMRRLRRATVLLAVSSDTADTLRSELEIPVERIRVVPPGVDHKNFRPRAVPPDFWVRYDLDPSRPYVLHVSSGEPRKDVPGLLAAWRMVVDRAPDAVLLKVGRTESQRRRDALDAGTSRLALKDHVRIIEEASDDDLACFYTVARALAFPSLAEGFGFPVLEAMACGTPVVCSDIPALRELTGAAAVRVPPRDPASLAEALTNLLHDSSRQAELSAAGRARALEFTWERTARETLAAYRHARELQGRLAGACG